MSSGEFLPSDLVGSLRLIVALHKNEGFYNFFNSKKRSSLQKGEIADCIIVLICLKLNSYQKENVQT